VTDDPTTVDLLDADADLGRALSDQDRAEASRHAATPVVAVAPGPWNPASRHCRPPDGTLGLLVLDGLISRTVRAAGGVHTELLGAGDLLRPWDEDQDAGGMATSEIEWRVLSPVRIAILGPRFAMVAGRWPQLSAELMCRALRRTRSQSILTAVSNQTRVDRRIHAAMWHLAERWGRVGPDGTHLPLRLTHATIAGLVGARRPTATTALTQLSAAGVVRRTPDGTWMLREPEAAESISLSVATG
jgi:CRP/FNR family transcriptional regulator, cyclic AMP receptor protein